MCNGANLPALLRCHGQAIGFPLANVGGKGDDLPSLLPDQPGQDGAGVHAATETEHRPLCRQDLPPECVQP